MDAPRRRTTSGTSTKRARTRVPSQRPLSRALCSPALQHRSFQAGERDVRPRAGDNVPRQLAPRRSRGPASRTSSRALAARSLPSCSRGRAPGALVGGEGAAPRRERALHRRRQVRLHREPSARRRSNATVMSAQALYRRRRPQPSRKRRRPDATRSSGRSSGAASVAPCVNWRDAGSDDTTASAALRRRGALCDPAANALALFERERLRLRQHGAARVRHEATEDVVGEGRSRSASDACATGARADRRGGTASEAGGVQRYVDEVGEAASTEGAPSRSCTCMSQLEA